MTFAEQRLDRFLCEMAMARADIYYQGIRRGRGTGQGLPKPGIHSLPNQMFDNRSMGRRCSNSHNTHSFDRFTHSVNIYLAQSFNIYHI